MGRAALLAAGAWDVPGCTEVAALLMPSLGVSCCCSCLAAGVQVKSVGLSILCPTLHKQ